jgi:hypothetical protein
MYLPQGFKRLSSYGIFYSIKSPAPGAGNISTPRLISQVGRLGEVFCQGVCAVRVVEVLVFLYLRSSCNYVTEVEVPLKFVRHTLKVYVQRDKDLVDIIL